MAENKEISQRRVYVLPTELVDRIVEYQKEAGHSSEVDAVRKLLNDALEHRDDWISITRKFLSRLKNTKILSDIAKEVLVGHPNVKSIELGERSLSFRLKTGETVKINSDSTVSATDENDDPVNFPKFMQQPKSPFGDPKPGRTIKK